MTKAKMFNWVFGSASLLDMTALGTSALAQVTGAELDFGTYVSEVDSDVDVPISFRDAALGARSFGP